MFRNCSRKSALSTFIAVELAYMSMNEELKHKQLIISKQFTNMLRRDESILVWNDYSADRPTEVLDERNQVSKLSLINATFLNNPEIIAVIRE